MIAESYDPEVIITAEWLLTNYSVNVTATAVSLHKLNRETFISFEQRLPLKELADTYEEKGAKRKKSTKKKNVTWDEVLPKLKYPFAKAALEACLTEKEADASRRRFVGFRSGYDGCTWINIHFREKYMNIYLKGDKEGKEDQLRRQFGDDIPISEWAKGLSFQIDRVDQYRILAEWLKMPSI